VPLENLDSRLHALVAHAYAHAPAVKRIMDEAGVSPDDIQSAADLARIPVTSKDKLIEMHRADPPFGGWLAMDILDLPHIYVSPGPIFDPSPPNPDADAYTGPAESLTYLGVGRGDRVLNTFAYHLTPAGSLLDSLFVHAGATVIPSGPGNTELQIMMMQALNISVFCGQPSYLMTILDKCEQMGLTKEQVSFKKALFSAEPYTPMQQQRFEGDYGMKTTSVYGTADLGFVGHTMERLQGFSIADTIYLQVCDPQTGEPLPAGEIGEIVATSFNKNYPLIRFGTGDLGNLAAEPDALTNGHQQLFGLYGRSGEAVKVRGMFLHPNQLRGAMMFFPQIKHAQVIVTRPANSDHVRLLLEMHPGESGVGLGEQLQALAQNAIRLRIDEVEIVETGVIDSSERTIRDERTWE
jgi:phenylacetate-CoA ligase